MKVEIPAWVLWLALAVVVLLLWRRRRQNASSSVATASAIPNDLTHGLDYGRTNVTPGLVDAAVAQGIATGTLQ